MKYLETGNLLLKLLRMQAKLTWMTWMNRKLLQELKFYRVNAQVEAMRLSQQADLVDWEVGE